jgi:beta-lactamase class A
MDINTFTRRQTLLIAGTSLLLPFSGVARAGALPAFDPKALAALERKVGGRLGVSVLDTGSGQLVGHRLDERFGMCSTFKMPLAAAILREIDQGRLRPDQWVPYGPADTVPHAPITQKHLQRGGMTVVALAEAAQTTSDNVAANLLLKLVGGPAGFTAILRTCGDTVTRLDRYEPHMNHVRGQDARDTTTPAAMARTTERLLTGDWLSNASRELLIGWMVATTTGELRIRAGLPNGWRSGDKTGTGWAPQMPNKYNDVAITWPPGKAPLVISAFYESARPHKGGMRDQDQAVLAEVGRIAATWSATI